MEFPQWEEDIINGLPSYFTLFRVTEKCAPEEVEEAYKRITTEASAKENKPAEETADATKETAKEVKEIKESSKKAEGFLAETVALLGPIKDALTPLVSTYAR